MMNHSLKIMMWYFRSARDQMILFEHLLHAKSKTKTRMLCCFISNEY